MKKTMITLLLVCICGAGISAQQAKDCFINMPDSLLPLLTAVNRADCIDFLGSKMKAEVTNRFGSKSEMTGLSADYIRIKMTDSSSWQMKLLPASDSTRVICVVATACAPTCDSAIRFYSTDWKELPSPDFLTSPTIKNFISTPDTVGYSVQDAIQRIDLLLMDASLSPTDNSLTFTFNTPEYIGTEIADKLKPYLHSPLVYVWERGKFVSR